MYKISSFIKGVGLLVAVTAVSLFGGSALVANDSVGTASNSQTNLTAHWYRGYYGGDGWYGNRAVYYRDWNVRGPYFYTNYDYYTYPRYTRYYYYNTYPSDYYPVYYYNYRVTPGFVFRVVG